MLLRRYLTGLARVEPVLIRKKFPEMAGCTRGSHRVPRLSAFQCDLSADDDSGGDVKAVRGHNGSRYGGYAVNTYAHIQQALVELGRKFEEGFYAPNGGPSPQAVPATGEPIISMTALLELT